MCALFEWKEAAWGPRFQMARWSECISVSSTSSAAVTSITFAEERIVSSIESCYGWVPFAWNRETLICSRSSVCGRAYWAQLKRSRLNEAVAVASHFRRAVSYRRNDLLEVKPELPRTHSRCRNRSNVLCCWATKRPPLTHTAPNTLTLLRVQTPHRFLSQSPSPDQ